MWPELGNLWPPLLPGLLEMRKKFRSLSAHMIVHSMVVQEWLSSFCPGGEHVPGLREDVGLLDGNGLAFALSMLMLLLSGGRDALAKPLPHDMYMLLPDVDISRRFACTSGITCNSATKQRQKISKLC